MAGMPNRYSMHSNFSGRTAQGAIQSSNQVSTQTLLNSLHTAYSTGKPYILDAATSVVVNTWATGRGEGGTVDTGLARRVWEHARRRCEDSTVILAYAFICHSTSTRSNSQAGHLTNPHHHYSNPSSPKYLSLCPQPSTPPSQLFDPS